MSRAGDTAIAATVQHRRTVVVDVILLLMRNGRILLRERANTGYGDGAYEPPTGQLADRETIVETAIRVASDEAGIAIRAENVSLAHVMHDVSGSGRIAFFLTVSGWPSEFTSPAARWFGVGNLPTNMLDRSRVALRNYAEGMRFSTYPAFGPAGTGGGPALFGTLHEAAPWQDAFSALPPEPDAPDELAVLDELAHLDKLAAMAEILNAHGSRNDIFVVPMTPRDFASGDELRDFVRRLCDRSGPFGGDGVYFYDAAPRIPEAWFFNPDGSSAEFCGNGMRCLGRVVLDLRGTAEAVIRSGPAEYTVRRGASTKEGVRQVSLEHPAVDFSPPAPVVAGRNPLTDGRLPELDPALTFTAVTIGNPHLVAAVDKYVEPGLAAMGERVAARRDLFPAGANLSVLLPLAPDEVFVRTFERGAGLTASCGSGMAASRAVWSRIGETAPEQEVLVRNAGGVATVSLNVQDGRWHPVVNGNATLVYRAEVDPAALARDAVEPYDEEERAYAALEEQNADRLRAAGVETAA